MPYQATRQPLFGVGSPNYVRPQIDVGGAIDAIAGSANSLVQQAYTRGMQQREQALREQEFQLQQQRETREAAAQTRQLDIAERGARAREAASGYTPAHTDMSMEYPAPTIPSRSPSKVATAMISGLPTQEGTSPLTQPVDLGTEGQPRLVTRDVDESYDPTHSVQYVRTMGAIGARGQVQDELADRRAASQQKLESMREAGRKALATVRGGIQATNQKAHDDRVASRQGNTKSMTEGQRATWRSKTAGDLIAANGGSYDDAATYLGSDEGKELRDRGLSAQDLFLAHGRATGDVAKRATTLVTGAQQMEPDSAVKIVRQVGAAAAKATPTEPAGGEAPTTPKPPVNIAPDTAETVESIKQRPYPPLDADESTLSNFWLFELKLKQGVMKGQSPEAAKRAALDYVKKRKKPNDG